MRALTLHQPYASAVAEGWKRTETRPGWARRLRKLEGEDLAICSAAHRDWPRDPGTAAARLSGRLPRPLWEAMRDVHGIPYPLAWSVEQPRGCVLAVATIGTVVPTQNVRDADDEHQPGLFRDYGWGPTMLAIAPTDRVWGDFTDYRVAIELRDVRRLDAPVPCRGYQQLWELPDDVAETVSRQLSPGYHLMADQHDDATKETAPR